jgi:proteasome accessory factor A
MWDYAGENPLLDARGFEVSGERERPSQQDNRAINKVLPNGGRLYVDGAHPEYSTPEVTNARDLVIFEKAGERLFDQCREAANGKLPPPQQLLIYKNNSDGKGNSYGYHENYLMARSVPFERLVEGLTPFLVSRIVVECGAGLVVEPADLAGFCGAALQLAESPALREQCGRAARRYAESRFDIERITDRFERILQGNDSRK